MATRGAGTPFEDVRTTPSGLHTAYGDIPPVEYEDNYYRSIAGLIENIPAELNPGRFTDLTD